MLSLNLDTWLNPEKTSSRFGSWSYRSGDGQPLGARGCQEGPGPGKAWACPRTLGLWCSGPGSAV